MKQGAVSHLMQRAWTNKEIKAQQNCDPDLYQADAGYQHILERCILEAFFPMDAKKVYVPHIDRWGLAPQTGGYNFVKHLQLLYFLPGVC